MTENFNPKGTSSKGTSSKGISSKSTASKSEGIDALLDQQEALLDAMNSEKSLEKQMHLYKKACALQKELKEKLIILEKQKDAIENNPNLHHEQGRADLDDPGGYQKGQSIDLWMKELEQLSKRFDDSDHIPFEEMLSLYARSLVIGKKTKETLESMSLHVGVLSEGVDGFHVEKRQNNSDPIQDHSSNSKKNDNDFPF